MSKTIGVAEVKRRFSEVIGKVSRDGEQIIIQKNHKPLVAMVSLKDFEIVKKSGRREENKGLLAAIGAWDDFEDIDKLIKQIYMARRKAKDRGMKGLS